ncbi:hypothetical protein E2626_01610 [Jeotgalibacillus salarius]|uniref:Uncharacterized protein n=1 Tax=Jeotgalibacillus salarius TaxID=546023 RepID=A0A4Y8LMG3_9BACL|nr:hypothetical protein E2626_01610 [Jeotgalibacillus salarius]
MRFKSLLIGSFTLALLVGCSDEEAPADTEETVEEEAVEKEETEPETSNQNEDLPAAITEEEGVIGGQVYEQEGTAVGTLVLEEGVSDEDAQALAEKYAEQIRGEYPDLNVNVQAVRGGENVASIEE